MSLQELQNRVYNENPNCRVEGKGNRIAIYFSSNNLYWPDTKECFEQAVIQKDRYEWTRQRIRRCSKHIFVRDVYKEWYATGINKDANDIDSLFELLKKETEGCVELITVGSSAGGYAAVLFGTWLNADLIFSFNGQWELNSAIKRDNYTRLEELRNNCGSYYDIVNKVGDTKNVFYFISKNSKWDIEQVDYSKKLNLNRIFFATEHHGIPFLKVALPVVLNMNRDQLIRLSNKTYNPILFTIRCVGFVKTMQGAYSQMKVKIKK